MQDGQAAAAIEHYKVVLKKDPAAWAATSSRSRTRFSRPARATSSSTCSTRSTSASSASPIMVFNVIQNMFYDDKLRDRAIPLFKRAWEAFPEERSNLISYVNTDQIWQMPEMYDYAREALIPKPASFVPAAQWNADHPGPLVQRRRPGELGRVAAPGHGRGARASSMSSAEQVDAARKTVPGWTAGGVVRAMIDCRLGRYDQATSAVTKLLSERGDDSLPANLFWVLGAELENHGPTRDLAVKAYEQSLSRNDDDPY